MITLIFKGSTCVALAPIDRKDGESTAGAARRAVLEALHSIPSCRDAEISHNPAGAPFIPGKNLFISVSHSRLTAAVAVDSLAAIGVDIEEPRERQLERVTPRVLSEAECGIYNTAERLLEAWTLKEALYKATGGAAPDFIRDIRLPMTPGDLATAAGRDCETVLSRHIAGQQLTVVRIKDGL